MTNNLTGYEIYHKKLEYSVSLFLDDVLDETPTEPIGEYFDITEIGNMIRIIPLFYCSEIISDGDNIVIDSPYMIMVPQDYKQIISFIGADNQKTEYLNIEYRIDNEVYVTVWVRNQDHGGQYYTELVPNVAYKIIYPNYEDEIRTTGYHGYDGFIMKESGFDLELI